MAVALEDALRNHDRIRRSTDLPLFYGRKEKDSVTPEFLIDRLEAAAVVARWDTDARKCTEFHLILRDRALLWWKSLRHGDINITVWDTVKTQFLKAYSPKFTAKTTCTNFQELVQKAGENVQDYFLRVSDTFEMFLKAKPAIPDAINNAYVAPVDGAVIAAVPAAAPDTLINLKREGLAQGALYTERFFLTQLFIAGLKDDLRSETMKAGKVNIMEAVDHARELEVINADRRKVGHISAISPTEPEDEDGDEPPAGMDEEEIRYVNVLRTQQGKKPYRFTRSGPPRSGTSSRSSSGSGPRPGTKCRYCHNTGHMQKECRKRKAANAPMVDATGKPFENSPNRITQIKENPDEDRINVIRECDLTHYALNW